MSRRTVTPAALEGAAGPRTVKHGIGRLMPYAPPWLTWLLLLPLAFAGWMAWGSDYDARPWYGIAVVAGTGGGVWMVASLTKGKHAAMRILAHSSVVAAGLWLLVAGLIGPTTRPLIDLWAGLGFTACVLWSIRRMLLASEAATTEQAAPGNAGKLLDLLDGAKLRKPRQLESGQIVAAVETDRGRQSVADVADRVTGNLESLAGLRPGAARVTASTTDAGMGELSIIAVDPLTEPIPWAGPSALGASITVPIPAGVYDTLDIARYWLPGDPDAGRNLAHWLIMGMSGSGKSAGEMVAAAEVLTRTHVTLWIHDHVKAVQTVAPLIEGGGIDRLTTTKADGKRMLQALHATIAARAAHLGRIGLEQWVEGCGLNLLVVLVEEAVELGDLTVLIRIVQQARSVGIVLKLSLQRATYASLDTDTRAQLGGRQCYGVQSGDDAGFGLPDVAIDGGAAPERWQANKPGSCYLTAPGIPEEMWAVPLRAYRATRQQLVDACRAGAPYRTPLDAVTVAAAGEWYSSTRPPTADDLGMPASRATDVAVAVEVDEDLDDDGIELPPNPDEYIQADPDEEIAPPDVDIPLGAGRPGRKLPTAEARAIVQQHLAALVAAGKTHTTAADVAKMRPETTRTREWVRTELIRLTTDAGAGDIALESTADSAPGEYRLLIPAAAHAG